MGGKQKQTLKFHNRIPRCFSEIPILLQRRDRRITLSDAVELTLDMKDGFTAGAKNQGCSRIWHGAIRRIGKSTIDFYDFIPGHRADNPIILEREEALKRPDCLVGSVSKNPVLTDRGDRRILAANGI